MTKEFTVVDKRGTKEEVEERPAHATPDSLYEEVQELRLTSEECFVYPSRGKIVVQEDVAMGKVGKIYIPDKVKKRPTTGIILRVGKDVEDYNPGDKIVYGLYSGTVITFKGWDPKTRINFRILSVDEILALLAEKTPELEGVGV